MIIKMSSDTHKRKKPNKQKRSRHEASVEPTTNPSPSHHGKNNEPFDPKQRLHAVIAAMKKDRARGSRTCEEKANHDY